MRFICILFVYALSGNALAAGMGEADARHLLLRTGFAPTPAEVRSYAALTRQQAVERLLVQTREQAQTPAPQWLQETLPPRPEVRAMAEAERREFAREMLRKGFELRAWWYREMLATPSPLTERMTLFWHNHFVSSLDKVKAPHLMYRQNVLLRQHALGNFGTLLHAVARDPAMVVYLDSASNRKGQPNENFAREVMELFTLGVGHYSERDIQEAARAFTGWSLDRRTYEYRFYPFLHDDGVKQVLGRSGNLNGDDVLDILLAQPATAEFIVGKLWREFVSLQPDAPEIKRLAAVFRASNYEIKPVLRALFVSDAFYAKQNQASLIKSPVELLVGAARQFQIQDLDPRLFALAGRQLGQDVFAPPNVKGWPGGEDWINSTTLLGRKQVMERLFRAQEMPQERRGKLAALLFTRDKTDLTNPEQVQQLAALRLDRLAANSVFDVDAWFSAFNGSEKARRTQAEKIVLVMPVNSTGVNDNLTRLDFLRHLVLDPAYQLK